MSAHNLETTIAMIRAHHRERIYAMEQRKRADLALGWFLKTALGWSKEQPAEVRNAVAARAADMVGIGEKLVKNSAKPANKRKPVEGADDLDFARLASVIVASVQSRQPFDNIEAANTKAMERLAEELPGWPWVAAIRGFGALGFATIIGEAGDLSNYGNPAKLWKRMGLALVDGVRQGGLSKNAPKEAWIAHGYNRNRRSRMWNIGQSLVKGNGDGAYRAVYLARKQFEREKAEAAGLTVAPSASIPKKRAAEFMSHGHIDKRAQRYMEKRLLRDLWRAWREAKKIATSTSALPPADLSNDARQSRCDTHTSPAGDRGRGHCADDTQRAGAAPSPLPEAAE